MKNFLRSPLIIIQSSCFYFYFFVYVQEYSDMHQSHHLVGYYATGINSLLISFLSTLQAIAQLAKLRYNDVIIT